MKNLSTRTIVFIHGAFVNYQCWDNWKTYFENKGYTCLAPPWPYKDAPADVLRKTIPFGDIPKLRLRDAILHYVKIIRDLPEKPIVIGHSYGGLLTQLMLNRDLAAAAVAIHSLPPQGVIPTRFSFYKATWKSLGFFTSVRRSYLMSFKDWTYAFTNKMTLQQQQTGYDEVAVPESKLMVRDALTSTAKVDFKKPHAPLLFTSGSIDHTIPVSLNRSNFKKYKNKNSITELKVFDGFNHFVLGSPAWLEVAEYVFNWLNNLDLKSETTDPKKEAMETV